MGEAKEVLVGRGKKTGGGSAFQNLPDKDSQSLDRLR